MTESVTPERELKLVNEQSQGSTQAYIAFATSDRFHVNQHFGSAKTFLVFGFSNGHWQVVKAIEYPEQPAGHDADKLAHRVQTLAQCQQIYCNEVGPSAVRRLLQQNIQPLKVAVGTSIKSLLKQHAGQLKPSAKTTADPDRLLNLLDEDWF